MNQRPPRPRWLLAPLLALIAVTASLAWWQTGKTTWQPPAALRPELPTSATTTIATHLQTVSTQQAQERPLLWVSRRPLEQDVTITASETTDDMGSARLVGVFESGYQQRVALLLKADGSKLTITSHSQPWRIEAFTGKIAVFMSDNKQRLEKTLEAGAAPPKPTPPAPPPQPRQRQQPGQQSQPSPMRQAPVQPRT